MSDGNLRSNWKWTLVRYVMGPILAVAIMAALVSWNIANRTKPWKQSEPISRQFQTHPESADWREYSDVGLRESLAANQVVLVDFVAKWSLESMENRVLLCRLPELLELMDQGKVVAMLADFSNRPPAVTVALRRLNHDSVPVVAIHSPKSDKPTVLTGKVTARQVADALAAAVK